MRADFWKGRKRSAQNAVAIRTTIFVRVAERRPSDVKHCFIAANAVKRFGPTLETKFPDSVLVVERKLIRIVSTGHHPVFLLTSMPFGGYFYSRQYFERRKNVAVQIYESLACA